MQKRLTIIGGGKSGIGAAQLAIQKSWDVFMTDASVISDDNRAVLDQLGVRWEDGGHSEKALSNCGLLIKSPGVPGDVSIVQEAVSMNIPVISEIEFASSYTKGKIVGVTGTNGKTTTCHMIAHILRREGEDVALAGNIGNSFAAELAANDHEWWVLELSSFQLDDIENFHPHIAVLLNITPDHLDRYSSLMDYAQSKMKIVQNQTKEDHFIFNLDDEMIAAQMEEMEISSNLLPISQTKILETGAWTSD